MELKKYKYIFLDRDGVINVERKDDYVKNPDELVYEANALEAISILSQYCDYIFVITNQRGVGRGKMSIDDLENVHDIMQANIQESGGRIDKIYYCTDIDSSSINRKPNIGMAYQAQADFPEINFTQSVMVGNSKSDIEFGRRLGMYTILIGNKYDTKDEIYHIADAHFMNLYEFALSLQNKQ